MLVWGGKGKIMWSVHVERKETGSGMCGEGKERDSSVHVWTWEEKG